MLSKAAPNPAFASFKGAADAYAAMRVGCFKDDKFQDIGTVVEKTRENEPARCLAKCRSGGFKYAGLQGERCSCGNSYGHWGPEPAGCNEPCPGQPAYACGGANRNTVLATGTVGAAGAGCYLQTGTIGKGGCPKQPKGFTAEIWWNKEDDASQQKCLAQAKEVPCDVPPAALGLSRLSSMRHRVVPSAPATSCRSGVATARAHMAATAASRRCKAKPLAIQTRATRVR